jgi:dolichol-phosphate mannosyltransferase
MIDWSTGLNSTENSEMKSAVIIPCYKVSRSIRAVLEAVPPRIHKIIVVDDKCPENSGMIAQSVSDSRIEVIFHETNRGVGGAAKSGYFRAKELGCNIMVKIDGDGQMNPQDVGRLIEPIERGLADYTKGNRFHDLTRLGEMPRIRLVGNSVLSFLIKFASGYWNLLDPTNGYTAISRSAVERIDLENISDSYFFEIDMLVKLNIANCVTLDIPMPPYYGSEESSLSISKTVRDFPFKIIKGLIRRVFLKYFIYDFNMASLYLLLGLPMFLFGVVLGIFEWTDSIATGIPRTSGTIMLVALPIILGFQMLLQALGIDISSVPSKAITDSSRQER